MSTSSQLKARTMTQVVNGQPQPRIPDRECHQGPELRYTRMEPQPPSLGWREKRVFTDEGGVALGAPSPS